LGKKSQNETDEGEEQNAKPAVGGGTHGQDPRKIGIQKKKGGGEGGHNTGRNIEMKEVSQLKETMGRQTKKSETGLGN